MTLRGSLDSDPRVPPVVRHADRAVHLRESGRPHGRRRRSRAKRGTPASTACCCSTTRSRRPSRSRQPLVDAGLDPIFLISPTTTDERIRRSAELGGGFLYVISRLGVTGARDALAGDAAPLLARVRAHASLPVALGFGISRPEHVAEACRHADAAVVGSALVQVIAAHADAPDLAARVERLRRMAEERAVEPDVGRRGRRWSPTCAAASTSSTSCWCALLSARAACALEIGRQKKLLGPRDLPAARARPRCSRTCSRSTRGRSTTRR